MTRVEALLIISLVFNVMMFIRIKDMINTNKLMKEYYDNLMMRLESIEEDILEEE